jgi:hypothetical protein
VNFELEFELDVPDLTWTQAERVAAACTGPQMLAVTTGPRRRWFRPRPPTLWISQYDADGRHLLADDADDADWDQPAWKMNPQVIPLLARTIQTLCRQLPQGFVLRAASIDDSVHADRERDVSCQELLGIVRASAMNPRVGYRVPAQTQNSDTKASS